MLLTPSQFLVSSIVIALAAAGIYVVANITRGRRLRKIASVEGMHFCPGDRFNLAAEVARRFPVAGAADPRVSDLLYCRRGECQMYVFRFEYTLGVAGAKVRRRVVAGFVEPRDRNSAPIELTLAPAADVEEQYRHVLDRLRTGATVGASLEQPPPCTQGGDLH